jgi:hypothetical protein
MFPSLCQVCSKIPLDLLLSNDDRSPIGTSYPIGTLSKIKSRQYCALCCICKEITDGLIDVKAQEWEDSSKQCSFRIRPKAENKYASEDHDPEWHCMRVPMMVFIGPHAYLEVSNLPIKPQTQTLIIQRSTAIPQKPFFLSDVQLRKLMGSARRCKLDHHYCNGMAGTASPVVSVPGLHLIDVRDRSIKAAEPKAQYITLSYRWGRRQNFVETTDVIPAVQGTDESHGRMRTLPDPMPPMLEDVIEVVRRLGQNFLWVDAYCINQKDPVEVQETVKRMDDIYENSLLTICPFWTDTDGGLPGVSVLFKTHRFRFLSHETVIYPIGHISDIDKEMIDSPWHGRGWIFQESVLSRQRLIFLPSSVVLLCQEQVVSPGFLTQKHSKTECGFRTDLQLRASLGTSKDWNFDVYQKIMVGYSSRNLSFQYDALNAISGILTRMSRQTGMAFQQALPTAEIQFLNALLWIPDIRYVKSVHQDGQITLRRRLEFASWSWLGFNIPIQYPVWLGPNPYSPQNLALRVKYNAGISSNLFAGNLEVETYDISLLEVAGFEFKGDGSGKPITVAITTESASFAISQGRPRFRGANRGLEVYWSLDHNKEDVSSIDSLLASRSSLSSFLIDSQVLSQLAPRAGVVRGVELLMLAHISDGNTGKRWETWPDIGDTVLAMAVVRTDVPNVVERVAIVPVPYACWELAEPELVALDII